jgi:hypothetical protein
MCSNDGTDCKSAPADYKSAPAGISILMMAQITTDRRELAAGKSAPAGILLV